MRNPSWYHLVWSSPTQIACGKLFKIGFLQTRIGGSEESSCQVDALFVKNLQKMENTSASCEYSFCWKERLIR